MKKLIAFRSGKFLLITENLAYLASRAVQKKKSYVGPFLLIKLFIGERHQPLTPRDYRSGIVFQCTISQVLKGDH